MSTRLVVFLGACATAIVVGLALGLGPAEPVCPALPDPVHLPACDCSPSVDLAILATEDRCSKVLDCRNVDAHANGTCSSDCNYCALRRALQLPSDTQSADHWQPQDEEETIQ